MARAFAEYFWWQDVDVSIPDLFPDRVLRVLGVGLDEHALRVRYEVVPPIEWVRWGERHPYVDWRLVATDDLGNAYADAGGAFGLAPDGRRTEGIRSLQPFPAEGVSWFDLVFSTANEAPPLGTARRILRIDVPEAWRPGPRR